MMSAQSALPMVSVVMPVRNEADFIELSLAAVSNQDYPQELVEILVGDGRSDDETRHLVSAMQQSDKRIQLIDNPGRIVSTGLNLLLNKARGEIIVRVDGHCRIAPDYVRRCVEHIQQDGVDGVGGPIVTIGSSYVAKTVAAGMSSAFGVGGSAFRTMKGKTMPTDTIPFPVYKREIIEKAGPYDEELVRNQDDEYNYRLRKFGAKLLLASDVRSEYFSRSTLRSLWKQYLQYGFWKVRVLQKHPRQMQWRQFVPPLFALSLIGGIALGLTLSWWPLGVVALAYVVAALVAAAIVAKKAQPSLFPLLPVTFFILHVGYGVGFLAGLVRFWNRWKG